MRGSQKKLLEIFMGSSQAVLNFKAQLRFGLERGPKLVGVGFCDFAAGRRHVNLDPTVVGYAIRATLYLEATQQEAPAASVTQNGGVQDRTLAVVVFVRRIPPVVP
jgi:hypothetical protein